ncbi:hypothetical protein J2W49_001470 [Hydrogenophaga palleronii]|uniref:Uncharacterized protein n=1 Tax=Hydrogenophaga palleronii TaxID=65655 RepID=A0ABU1WKJ1_9BURK|nr:hypothetical protein [Hydrogenophaga palleronii]MDR7149521.1 hypothetical protein [Hydrogenophaga palleronii]
MHTPTSPREPREGLRDTLAQRQQRIEQARPQLKAELIGIDDVIDRVMEAVSAW